MAAVGRRIRWLDAGSLVVLDFLGQPGLSDKDTFDRMLATQAIAESATLVTARRRLHVFPRPPRNSGDCENSREPTP